MMDSYLCGTSGSDTDGIESQILFLIVSLTVLLYLSSFIFFVCISSGREADFEMCLFCGAEFYS